MAKDKEADAQVNADPTPPPEENAGSGQYAVWDVELGQFVSGVGDKATADQSMKDLGNAEDGAVTDGHTLEVREV